MSEPTHEQMMKKLKSVVEWEKEARVFLEKIEVCYATMFWALEGMRNDLSLVGSELRSKDDWVAFTKEYAKAFEAEMSLTGIVDDFFYTDAENSIEENSIAVKDVRGGERE